ncbi:MAG: PKD domain-containing protein, partial [Methanogenium sp.]|nr:PKD domain-containing protein [Methanogenium sp.]
PNGYMNNYVTSGNTLETYHRGILNLLNDNEKGIVLNYLEKTEGNNILPYSSENNRMPYIYFYLVFEKYDNIIPNPPSWTNHLNPNANYQVFRENWEEDSDWLSLITFNGQTNSNRDTAHHDQLSIEYYGEGNLLLADAGENKYVIDQYYGEYAVHHNGIAIENPVSSYPVSDWADSESRGVFKGNANGIATQVTVDHIVETPWIDILNAKETINNVIGDSWAYPYSLSSPVDYTRTIIHNDNDYFVIFDRLTGNEEWIYRNVFRPGSLDIAPTVDLNNDYIYSESETGHVNGNLKIGGTEYNWLSLPYKTETDTGIKTNSVIWETTNPYGNNVHLNIFSVPASEVLLTKHVGRIAGYTKQSEVFSPILYLREEPAENLYRITALLSDYDYDEQKIGEVIEVNGNGNALRVTTSNGQDYFYSGDGTSAFDKFETDADIVYVRQSEDTSDFRSTIIKGSYLNAEGLHLVELSGIDLATINREGDSVTIVTDGESVGEVRLYQIESNVAGVLKDGISYGNWQFSDGNTSLIIGTDSGKHEYKVLFSEELLPVQTYPVAGFSADIFEGELPLEVQFTDTSTNNPDTWLWSFGDAEESYGENPVHTFSEPGTYTVTLKASNDEGSDTAVKIDYIKVLSTPPVTEPGEDAELDADFTADIIVGTAPLEVHFTDVSPGLPEHWTYYFGDGDTTYEQNPVHTYTKPGTYDVILRVMKDRGLEMDIEEKSGYIIVTDGPVSVSPVADFISDTVEGDAGLEVHFTDTSTNN